MPLRFWRPHLLGEDLGKDVGFFMAGDYQVPSSSIRDGIRSWEVTPCFAFTKLYHRFGSIWLDDNLLLLLSSHLALAHFAVCVMVLQVRTSVQGLLS